MRVKRPCTCQLPPAVKICAMPAHVWLEEKRVQLKAAGYSEQRIHDVLAGFYQGYRRGYTAQMEEKFPETGGGLQITIEEDVE